MSRSTPLVSIVTPVYNGGRFLDELIESVLAQTYPCIEHIVIDDGSTDEGVTRAVLARHPQTKSWTRPNRGQYSTVNEGFAAAKGTILTTISADDFYVDPRAIERVVSHFDLHDDCDLVLGLTRHVDEQGRPLEPQPFQRFPFWMMPYHPFVSHCSLFISGSRFPAGALRFDESLRFLGDADWTVRMYLAGRRYCRIDTEIAAYRYHGDQATSKAATDSASGARRVDERRRFDERYVRYRSLKALIDVYVTCHRRRGIALAALRRGGILELERTLTAWRARRLR